MTDKDTIKQLEKRIERLEAVVVCLGLEAVNQAERKGGYSLSHVRQWKQLRDFYESGELSS